MDERRELGQFIPLQYHFNMLNDVRRTDAFAEAIAAVVRPGATVVELGGGTGVLSFFAARAGAARVFCVEYNPELVAAARALARRNGVDDVVEVVDADALEYLPPEPADVVICEMLHTGLLRERQVQVVESFKHRHRERFGPRLPSFVPEAVVQAVQPLAQDFVFHGYDAPTVHFQDGFVVQPRSSELAPPAVYHSATYADGVAEEIAWRGRFAIERDGTANAARLITKNLLAILPQEGRSIDWLMNYLVFPLGEEVPLARGDELELALAYRAGARLDEVELAARRV